MQAKLFSPTRIALNLIVLVLLASLFAVLLPAKSTSALSGSDFDAGRIIDDSVFYNHSTMSISQIQNFLNAKVPICDTNGDVMINSTQTRKQWAEANGKPLPPYICLKSYKQDVPAITNGGSDLCKNSITAGNKTAAQIIYDVSKACGINPQVLIVLLQKEQSLVTDDWPWPIQYRSATGYGCPDTAPCDEEYYGFFNQVYQAAKAFRRYEANPDNYNYRAGRNNTIYYHPDLSRCGSSTVFIENQATANLYIYTPYRPNSAALNNLYGEGDSCSSYGNRNFWRMFNDWFGPTGGTPFFRIGSDSKVFMLGEQNKYYYVSSPVTLRAYGWGEINNTVLSYSASYLDDKTFSGDLPTIARFGGDEIYLMDKGLYRHFTSKELLTNFGYAIGDEATLPTSFIYLFRPAASVRTITRDLGDGKIYLISNGIKRHFTGPSAYKSGNPKFSSLPRIDLSNDYLLSINTGASIHKPGTLIRIGATNPVYVITSHESKSYISSKEKMKEFNFDFKKVKSVNQQFADAYIDSDRLEVFVVKSENNSIRLIMEGNKVLAIPDSISDPSRFNLSKNSLVKVTNDILETYTASGSATELIRADGQSKVYKIESGEKRHVSSPAVLSSLGYSFDDVTNVSEYLVNLFPTGLPL